MPLYSSSTKLVVALVLALATSLQGLLTTASKTNGRYSYKTATVPFLAEIVKLVVSSTILARQRAQSPATVRMNMTWRSVSRFVVPSFIYLVHNNVQFWTLRYVDAPTYQIMGNLKILTTGLFFRIILKRHLTQLQCIALALLVIGATTSQIMNGCLDSAADASGAARSGGQRVFQAPWQGYALGVLSACLSGLAGVYTEYIMKRNDEDSLYWQNVQLYSFGVVFNTAGLVTSDIRSGFEDGVTLFPSVMFKGYTLLTWFLVANLAFTGLLVSWLMKFTDNILKVYSTSLSMLATMAVSSYLFGTALTLPLALGIMTASASVLLYYMDPSTLVADAARVAALNAATSMGGGGGSVAAAAHHSGGGAAGSGGAPAELSGVRVVDVPGRGGEAMLVGGGAGFGPGAGVIHQGAGYSGGSGPSTAAAAVGIGAATTAGGFVSSILSSAFGGGGGGDAEAGGGIKAVKGN